MTSAPHVHEEIAPVVPTSAPTGVLATLRPLSLTDVVIESGPWAHLQSLNRTSIIPHCRAMLEDVGWVENLRAAARGTLLEDRRGRLFSDSEIYKVMEALAWEDARDPGTDLREQLDDYARLLTGAQSEDGYLNTFHGHPGGPVRYGDLSHGHELYCAGHLLQAAVAALRAGAVPQLEEVARRLADHVCAEFAPGAREGVGGHPEIETALVELYRATGEERYLRQASVFVERRGRRTLPDTMFKGRGYYQDDVPVREAEILVGHAVRALYLAAGAVDVAVETGDVGLLAAVRGQYDRTLERRTYVTGGMGSNHHGETFGDDFEVPSERAYAETCAAVASVQLAWRLLLATGEERYADVIERTLHNTVAACPSDDGRRFFYVNALQRRSPGVEPEPEGPSLRRTDGRRAAWFTTSCCPTNVARLISSLGAYVATTDEDGVQLHQYAAGVVTARFGQDDRSVRLRVRTSYPDDGLVSVLVEETDGEEWTLSLRVPGWAAGAVVAVLAAGEPEAPDDREREVAPGTTVLRRRWRAGDEVRLRIPVEPRFTAPDPRIDAVRGCVAVERGPLVYAVESVDQPGHDLDLVTVDTSAPLRVGPAPEGLPGCTTVVARAGWRTAPAGGWPYHRLGAGTVTDDEGRLVLVPYARWANRSPSTMRVWIPTR